MSLHLGPPPIPPNRNTSFRVRTFIDFRGLWVWSITILHTKHQQESLCSCCGSMEAQHHLSLLLKGREGKWKLVHSYNSCLKTSIKNIVGRIVFVSPSNFAWQLVWITSVPPPSPMQHLDNSLPPSPVDARSDTWPAWKTTSSGRGGTGGCWRSELGMEGLQADLKKYKPSGQGTEWC